MAIGSSCTVLVVVGLITLIITNPKCLGLEDNNNNNNNSKPKESDLSELCPCTPRDRCPRVYGQSATDIRELGFVKPCEDSGTVRCCGVSIHVEKNESEGIQLGQFRPLAKAETTHLDSEKDVEDLQVEESAPAPKTLSPVPIPISEVLKNTKTKFTTPNLTFRFQDSMEQNSDVQTVEDDDSVNSDEGANSMEGVNQDAPSQTSIPLETTSRQGTARILSGNSSYLTPKRPAVLPHRRIVVSTEKPTLKPKLLRKPPPVSSLIPSKKLNVESKSNPISSSSSNPKELITRLNVTELKKALPSAQLHRNPPIKNSSSSPEIRPFTFPKRVPLKPSLHQSNTETSNSFRPKEIKEINPIKTTTSLIITPAGPNSQRRPMPNSIEPGKPIEAPTKIPQHPSNFPPRPIRMRKKPTLQTLYSAQQSKGTDVPETTEKVTEISHDEVNNPTTERTSARNPNFTSRKRIRPRIRTSTESIPEDQNSSAIESTTTKAPLTTGFVVDFNSGGIPSDEYVLAPQTPTTESYVLSSNVPVNSFTVDQIPHQSSPPFTGTVKDPATLFPPRVPPPPSPLDSLSNIKSHPNHFQASNIPQKNPNLAQPLRQNNPPVSNWSSGSRTIVTSVPVHTISQYYRVPQGQDNIAVEDNHHPSYMSTPSQEQNPPPRNKESKRFPIPPHISHSTSQQGSVNNQGTVDNRPGEIIQKSNPLLLEEENYDLILYKENRNHPRVPLQQPQGNPGGFLSNNYFQPMRPQGNPSQTPNYFAFDSYTTNAGGEAEETRIHPLVIENVEGNHNKDGTEALTNDKNSSPAPEGSSGTGFKPKRRYRPRLRSTTTTSSPVEEEEKNILDNNAQQHHPQYSIENSGKVVKVSLAMGNPAQPISLVEDLATNHHEPPNNLEQPNPPLLSQAMPQRFNPNLPQSSTSKPTLNFSPTSHGEQTPAPMTSFDHYNSQDLSSSGPPETLIGNSPGWLAMNVESSSNGQVEASGNFNAPKQDEKAPSGHDEEGREPTVNAELPSSSPKPNPVTTAPSTFTRPYKTLNRKRVTTTVAPKTSNHHLEQERGKSGASSQFQESPQDSRPPQKKSQGNSLSEGRPTENRPSESKPSAGKVHTWRPKVNSTRRFPVPNSFNIFSQSNVAENNNVSSSNSESKEKHLPHKPIIIPQQQQQPPLLTLPPTSFPQRLSIPNRLNSTSTSQSNFQTNGAEDQNEGSKNSFFPTENNEPESNNHEIQLPHQTPAAPTPRPISSQVSWQSSKPSKLHGSTNEQKQVYGGAGEREPRPTSSFQNPPGQKPSEQGRRPSPTIINNPDGFSISFSTLPGGATVYHPAPPPPPKSESHFPHQETLSAPFPNQVKPPEGGRVIFPNSKPVALNQPSFPPPQRFSPSRSQAPSMNMQQAPSQHLLPQQQQVPPHQSAQEPHVPPPQNYQMLSGNYQSQGQGPLPPRHFSQGNPPPLNHFRPNNPSNTNHMERPSTPESNSHLSFNAAQQPFQHHMEQAGNLPHFAPPLPVHQQHFQHQPFQPLPPHQPPQQQPAQQHMSLTQSIIQRMKNSFRGSRAFNFSSLPEATLNESNMTRLQEIINASINNTESNEIEPASSELFSIAKETHKEFPGQAGVSRAGEINNPIFNTEGLRGNEEEIHQNGFKEPEFLERGFIPVRLYSEMDPGPILMKISENSSNEKE